MTVCSETDTSGLDDNILQNSEKLKDVLDNLINNKPEQAQTVFHDYLKNKLTGVLGEVPHAKSPIVDK